MDNGVRRVLHLASQVLGGPRLLAARLKVDAPRLDRWLRGVDAPPPELFLLAVDLLLDWSTTPARDIVQDLRREVAAQSVLLQDAQEVVVRIGEHR